jgi:hypothetical protein
MKPKYTFICEAANVSQSGNLNVLGIFQNFNATNFPVTIPRMVYVASIEFHRSEVGKHHFKVNFIDEDGKPLIPQLDGEIIIPENNLFANLMLGIENIPFSKAGIYAIDLVMDNQHLATDNIHVFKMNN